MTKRIPRLKFEELDAEVAGALVAKYERLGYLCEFFQCMGHQPRGLKAFINFTDAAKGALPDKIVDRAAPPHLRRHKLLFPGQRAQHGGRRSDRMEGR